MHTVARTNATEPDEREAKLPAWARESLRDLRNRVRDAERVAAAAELETREGSDLFLVEYTGQADEHRIGLGDRAAVRRYVSDKWDRECYLEIAAVPEGVSIRSTGTGIAQSIAVQPRSGNEVHAFLTEWR
jgi:hypothetical protein